MKTLPCITSCFHPKAPRDIELDEVQREAQFQTPIPSTSTFAAHAQETGRERRTSPMEIQLRSALDKAKQVKPNADGTPPLAAMQLLGQKTLEKLNRESNSFLGYLKRLQNNPTEFEQDRNRKAIFQKCKSLAYDVYAREIGRTPVRLGENEQEKLFDELQKIENDKVYLKAQERGAGFDPLRTLISKSKSDTESDRTKALKTNFYIVPRASIKESKDKIDSRITLSVKPDHVAEVAKKLTDEFGGKFDDIFNYCKVMAANEHGQRSDNIVIYLGKTDPKRAKQFAEHLCASMSNDAWEQQSPLGMHAFFPGIAYGEWQSGKDNDSFGSSRAHVVADAMLMHLKDKTPLDDAMKAALKSHKCSLENPAFIERRKLDKILGEL